MKFHHIGLATNDIESLIAKLKKQLEIKSVSEIVYDPKQEASLCLLSTNDNVKIELVSGKIVQNFIKKGQILYHTCYVVKNIGEKINELVNDGAMLIRSAQEAVLFANHKVAFLRWDLGIIELLEGDEGL